MFEFAFLLADKGASAAFEVMTSFLFGSCTFGLSVSHKISHILADSSAPEYGRENGELSLMI